MVKRAQPSPIDGAKTQSVCLTREDDVLRIEQEKSPYEGILVQPLDATRKA